MDYKGILLRLAPCGLDCSRCFRFHDSEIKELSKKLSELLYGFEDVAELISTWFPKLKNTLNSRKFWVYFSKVIAMDVGTISVLCPAGHKIASKKKGLTSVFSVMSIHATIRH